MKYFQDHVFLSSLYGAQDHIEFRGNFLKTFSNRKHSLRDVAMWFIGNPRGKRIIDIGAGSGSFLRKIIQHSPQNEFAALDIVENEECKSLQGVEYRIFDGKILPVGLGKWDVVILMHVLYHVPKLKPFLNQVRLMLRSPGSVLISTKSRKTLAGLETVFQKIKSIHFRNLQLPRHRDEAHFCSENGLRILRGSFNYPKYLIDEYPIETQIIVDDYRELIRYVLSTPRYNPGTYGLRINEDEYVKLWENELKSKRLYVDMVKEMLYVVTEDSRV